MYSLLNLSLRCPKFKQKLMVIMIKKLEFPIKNDFKLMMKLGKQCNY